MTTVATNKLFLLRSDLNHEESVCARCAGLKPDKVYWLIGSRKSSLGGFLGTYEGTYGVDSVSPDGRQLTNIPTRYLRRYVSSWKV